MRILLVDDSRTIRHLMAMKIKELGHDVSVAKDGIDAWEKINKTPVDIVITDWIMPNMDGLELCRRIRGTKFENYIYVIFTSIRNSQQDLIEALKAGADDFLSKPVDSDELEARIKIGDRIVSLQKDIRNKYEQIRKNYHQTIHMFTNFIEVFNKDLAGHSRRVAELSLKIAKRTGKISKDDLQILEIAALLHDVGMIGLPNEILRKKRTEMTGEERKQYLSHPVRGELILKEIEFLRPVAKLVRLHHEQYNGHGFPDGLSDKQIPLSAKIISASSIYDNLVHRGKVPLEEVPANMERMRGYQLDPAMVDILLQINLEKIQEKKKERFVKVSVNDLKEGNVLAEDLYMFRGALILPAKTRLTKYDIEKLSIYEKSGCINKDIKICKAVNS